MILPCFTMAFFCTDTNSNINKINNSNINKISVVYPLLIQNDRIRCDMTFLYDDINATAYLSVFPKK